MGRVNNPRATIAHLTKQMKEKGAGPGALFIYQHNDIDMLLSSLNQDFNNKGLACTPRALPYKILRISYGSCLIFLDIVYSAFDEKHYFRFLDGENIVGLPFVKGKSIKALNKTFKIINSE